MTTTLPQRACSSTRMAAPAASVDRILADVIRVGVAAAVLGTDALHNLTVATPVHAPRAHVVIRRVVDATLAPDALRLQVHTAEHLAADEDPRASLAQAPRAGHGHRHVQHAHRESPPCRREMPSSSISGVTCNTMGRGGPSAAWPSFSQVRMTATTSGRLTSTSCTRRQPAASQRDNQWASASCQPSLE